MRRLIPLLCLYGKYEAELILENVRLALPKGNEICLPASLKLTD